MFASKHMNVIFTVATHLKDCGASSNMKCGTKMISALQKRRTSDKFLQRFFVLSKSNKIKQRRNGFAVDDLDQ